MSLIANKFSSTNVCVSTAPPETVARPSVLAFCPSLLSVCQQCHKRHHTSICDAPRQETNQPTPTTGVALTTNQVGEGLFPVLVVEVNGIKCRVLIDSGAGSSYVSAKLIDLLCVKSSAVQTKSIDMLMSTKVAAFEV